MRNILSGLIVGLIFGAGLALSDMVNPARVQAFLDVAGAWDPTLAVVMAAAILPSAIAYLIRRRVDRPLLEASFSIPESRALDRPLLLGALLFGIGWGLVGFCPGPALAGLVLGAWQAWLFVTAMLVGMALHTLALSRAARRPSDTNMGFNHLSPTFVAAPQLETQDIGRLAAAGFKGIINNRPDHEAKNQPRSDELEAEAKRHGLDYRHIPIVPGRATAADARALAAALKEFDGPVVAFCRTGNRASALWKAAQLGS